MRALSQAFALDHRINRLIRCFKDVGLARVVFAFDAGNDPVAGAYDMTAFQCVDPTMLVHDHATVHATALTCVGFVWVAKVAHHVGFPAKPFSFSAFSVVGVVHRVIAILEPLRGLNDHWLLSEFHFFTPNASRIRSAECHGSAS